MTATAESTGAGVQTGARPGVIEWDQRRHGAVTLSETDDGWEILGTRTAGGSVYRFTVKRCLCVEHAQAIYDDKQRQGKYAAAFADRPAPLCPEPPGHNLTGRHSREYDHCPSLGHEAKVRALFERVAKTYETAPALPTRAAVIKASGNHPRITASKTEREAYLRWLAANDPEAANPYAKAGA